MSVITSPVQPGEHESLPIASTLSSEDLGVDSVDIQGTSCPTLPAGQLKGDCHILTQLHSDSSEEQKLDIIIKLEKFNPPSTYKFPTKLEYGKKRAFQHQYSAYN